MKLFNNTPNEALYTISGGGSDSCGTIDPGQTVDDHNYNNMPNVQVFFSNNSGGPFSITIPNSGEGMAVTVGIFFQ